MADIWAQFENTKRNNFGMNAKAKNVTISQMTFFQTLSLIRGKDDFEYLVQDGKHVTRKDIKRDDFQETDIGVLNIIITVYRLLGALLEDNIIKEIHESGDDQQYDFCFEDWNRALGLLSNMRGNSTKQNKGTGKRIQKTRDVPKLPTMLEGPKFNNLQGVLTENLDVIKKMTTMECQRNNSIIGF